VPRRSGGVLLAFGFNHDPVVHYQIGSKAAFELHIFIHKWHSFLSLNLHAGFLCDLCETFAHFAVKALSRESN
jgi:hypothetical protein